VIIPVGQVTSVGEGQLSEYMRTHDKVPAPTSVGNAIDYLQADAKNGETQPLHTRVAHVGDDIYYDMTTPDWGAVHVTAGKWELIPHAPPIFRRRDHHQPQVVPDPSGDIRKLLDFLPIADEGSKRLLLVWLVSCLIPDIPHPILNLYGTQGAGKSFTARLLRKLIDPDVMETVSFPSKPQDLINAIDHNYVVPFDNIASLGQDESDMLCRSATGEAQLARKLYTDNDAYIFRFRRCIILNGINVPAARPDLLDRSILICLERIAEAERRDEASLLKDFEEARPQILGGMFNALARAIEIQPGIFLPKMPRMADFAQWGCAIADALESGGNAFLAAYAANDQLQSQEALAADAVAGAVIEFVSRHRDTTNSPTDLLGKLEAIESVDPRSPDWPQGSNALTRRLNDLKETLSKAGVGFTAGKSGNRIIRLWRMEEGKLDAPDTILPTANGKDGESGQ